MAFLRGNPGHPGGNPQWQKGVSGNPNGRPRKIVEVTEAARQRTVAAIETLEEIMLDPKATASARVSAAIALLERGWGKAPQTIDVRRSTDFREMSDDELLAVIAAGDVEGPASNGGTGPATAQDDPEIIN
jgi:hypothetical protein